MNKDAFFQYKESRALSGYKSALLVKLPYDNPDGKYSLVVASETAPYVFGDRETFDYNLLQAPTKGQVAGKMDLDSKDINVLHHRDNAYRFEKIKGLTLDCMTINAELMGYKFVATLDYRPNDAEADVNTATLTITPMSAETSPVYNARPYIIETLAFAQAIPESVMVGDTVNLSVLQDVTPTVSAVKIADGTNAESDASSDITATDISKVGFSAAGLYALTVKADGYASWTTTVYVAPAPTESVSTFSLKMNY